MRRSGAVKGILLYGVGVLDWWVAWLDWSI